MDFPQVLNEDEKQQMLNSVADAYAQGQKGPILNIFETLIQRVQQHEDTRARLEGLRNAIQAAADISQNQLFLIRIYISSLGPPLPPGAPPEFPPPLERNGGRRRKTRKHRGGYNKKDDNRGQKTKRRLPPPPDEEEPAPVTPSLTTIPPQLPPRFLARMRRMPPYPEGPLPAGRPGGRKTRKNEKKQVSRR